MTDELDPNLVVDRLLNAGIVAGISGRDLSVLSTKGISHDHWRVGDTKLVLRIPRMNQWGLPPETALAYQAAAFERASACGRTPLCRGVLDPGPELPSGALLIHSITSTGEGTGDRTFRRGNYWGGESEKRKLLGRGYLDEETIGDRICRRGNYWGSDI